MPSETSRVRVGRIDACIFRDAPACPENRCKRQAGVPYSNRFCLDPGPVGIGCPWACRPAGNESWFGSAGILLLVQALLALTESDEALLRRKSASDEAKLRQEPAG